MAVELATFLKDSYLAGINPHDHDVKKRIKSNTQDADPTYIRRPEQVPENQWNSMDGAQRYTTFCSRWLKNLVIAIQNGRIELDHEFMLRAIFPEKQISSEVAKVVLCILQYSDFNEINFTIPALIDYVQECMVSDKPIKIRMSQCINRGMIYRSTANKYALLGLKNQSMDRFSDGVELRGWQQMRSLLDAMPSSTELEIVLGDMDYYVLEDGAYNILDNDSLVRLNVEMSLLKGDIQRKADNFFGDHKVCVLLWSDHYDLGMFNGQLDLVRKRKEDLGTDVEKVLEERRRDYYRLWGYQQMAEENGISASELDMYISTDLLRMVAQYRLESVMARADGCIQCTSEASSNPAMPLVISHALRGADDLTPTLFMGTTSDYYKAFDEL